MSTKERVRNSLYKSLHKDFLYNWLIGTTCHREAERKIIWASKGGRWLILKHTGHTTYLYRSMNGYCETYFELHDLKYGAYVPYHGRGVKEWKGRWNKDKQKEAERIIHEQEQKERESQVVASG